MRWLLLFLCCLIPVAYSAVPVDEMSQGKLQKTCRKGAAESCTQLGRLEYRQKDHPKANEWYEKGCELGDPRGCCNMGLAYWLGRGVEKDFPKAGPLLAKGCDADVALCCSSFGMMHKNGQLSTLDGPGLLKVFEKGCAAGDMPSCFEVGFMKDAGDKVPRDLPNALIAYEKTCEAGNQTGCFNAGRVHRLGKEGVEYNEVKAHHYFKRACDGGFGDRACREAKGFKRMLDCRQICANLDDMFASVKNPTNQKLKKIIRYQSECYQGCLRDGTIEVECALEADTVEAFLPCSNY